LRFSRRWLFRMPFSGIWCRVVVWTDVSEGRGCSHLLRLVPRFRIFLPCRWRRYVPPKHRFTQELHGATSQKTAFFIVCVLMQFWWNFLHNLLNMCSDVNTLRTGRQLIDFWLLNVADRESINWLLSHALFQSTICSSGVLFLPTIGSKCYV
jgi:hypothetical protein